ncbi:hypothetical protein BKA93DRAFT_833552 [Sparassis latifolia]
MYRMEGMAQASRRACTISVALDKVVLSGHPICSHTRLSEVRDRMRRARCDLGIIAEGIQENILNIAAFSQSNTVSVMFWMRPQADSSTWSAWNGGKRTSSECTSGVMTQRTMIQAAIKSGRRVLRLGGTTEPAPSVRKPGIYAGALGYIVQEARDHLGHVNGRLPELDHAQGDWEALQNLQAQQANATHKELGEIRQTYDSRCKLGML